MQFIENIQIHNASRRPVSKNDRIFIVDKLLKNPQKQAYFLVKEAIFSYLCRNKNLPETLGFGHRREVAFFRPFLLRN